MKNYLFILVFLMNFNLFSQTNVYHPFPTANAIWTEEFYGNPMMGCSFMIPDVIFSHTIIGDTILNNITYQKIYSNMTDYFGNPPINSCRPFYCNFFFPFISYQVNYFGYTGSIREDSLLKEIYFLPKDSVQEVLLYEFDLGVGDHFKNSFLFDTSFYVASIDSVFDGTGYRKKLLLANTNGAFGYQAIIEGIGSVFGLFECQVPFEWWSNLTCFSHNGQTIYPNPNSQACGIVGIDELPKEISIATFPNPVCTTLNIHVNPTENFSYQLLNTQGQVLLSQKVNASNTKLDLNNLNNGVYTLAIILKNKNIYHKQIVVVH
ncbi:MAG: T9SS type A sorting domain-containing protein [Bacteroidetes bacterium]|nr:T9SS type A sorting domain-containing protein [Bacteroidota bacterium]